MRKHQVKHSALNAPNEQKELRVFLKCISNVRKTNHTFKVECSETWYTFDLESAANMSHIH